MKLLRKTIRKLIKETSNSNEVAIIDNLLEDGAMADAIYFWEMSGMPIEAVNWGNTPVGETTSDEALRAMLQLIIDYPDHFGSAEEYPQALKQLEDTIAGERDLIDQGKEKEFQVWMSQARNNAIKQINDAHYHAILGI